MWKRMLAVLLVLVVAVPALADVESERIHAIAVARKSVVSIRTYYAGTDQPGIGSGIILRSDGYILTNYHVVRDARVIKVYMVGGKQYTATVYKSAPTKDLSLLKVDATNLPVARVGNSDEVRLGETAIAIGDPLGFMGTVTVGTVSGMGRNIEVAGVHYKRLIQTDAAINPGSSGGALVDLHGDVIGINTLVYTGPQAYKHAQGLGFAIPINEAVAVARQLAGAASPTQGKAWLGITGENLTPDLASAYGIPVQHGVLVTSVVSGSPAQDSNLRVGDAITSADDHTVLNVSQFLDQLQSHKPGDTVKLAVWRQGKKSTVMVKLDVQSQ